MARARSAESFGRRSPRFKPQPLVLVICEDSKSAKIYLEDASRHFRAFAKVQVIHTGKTDPKGIVAEAVARASKFDLVFCVIDGDKCDTENFKDAMVLASGHQKIKAQVSYPCFEFWLLLHFEYTRAPFMPAGGTSACDRVMLQLRTKPNMEAYAKGRPEGLFATLLGMLPVARTHAARSVRDGETDGQMNPSTTLHLLITEFERLGKPIPIEA